MYYGYLVKRKSEPHFVSSGLRFTRRRLRPPPRRPPPSRLRPPARRVRVFFAHVQRAGGRREAGAAPARPPPRRAGRSRPAELENSGGFGMNARRSARQRRRVVVAVDKRRQTTVAVPTTNSRNVTVSMRTSDDALSRVPFRSFRSLLAELGWAFPPRVQRGFHPRSVALILGALRFPLRVLRVPRPRRAAALAVRLGIPVGTRVGDERLAPPNSNTKPPRTRRGRRRTDASTRAKNGSGASGAVSSRPRRVPRPHPRPRLPRPAARASPGGSPGFPRGDEREPKTRTRPFVRRSLRRPRLRPPSRPRPVFFARVWFSAAAGQPPPSAKRVFLLRRDPRAVCDCRGWSSSTASSSTRTSNRTVAGAGGSVGSASSAAAARSSRRNLPLVQGPEPGSHFSTARRYPGSSAGGSHRRERAKDGIAASDSSVSRKPDSAAARSRTERLCARANVHGRERHAVVAVRGEAALGLERGARSTISFAPAKIVRSRSHRAGHREGARGVTVAPAIEPFEPGSRPSGSTVRALPCSQAPRVSQILHSASGGELDETRVRQVEHAGRREDARLGGVRPRRTAPSRVEGVNRTTAFVPFSV